jgi:hypothetical protein
MPRKPIISCIVPLDERTLWEAEAAGSLSHVYVDLEGKRYQLTFYTVVRLEQDLKVELELGKRCMGEPGLVIVERVTMDNIIAAVDQLDRERFFDGLAPLKTTSDQ